MSIDIDPSVVLASRIAGMSRLPRSQHSLILRGLQQVFATDPDLVLAGTTVRAWSGDPLEQMAPNYPELPMVRLTPMIGPSAWANEGQHLFTIPTAVELYSPGVDITLLLDLASACFTALFPVDPTRSLEVASYLPADQIVRCEWVKNNAVADRIGGVDAPYAMRSTHVINTTIYADSRWWGGRRP